MREARVEAEIILRATRDSLRTRADAVEPGEAERIGGAIAALETAHAGEDYVAIRDAVEALNQLTEPFARRIMDHSLTEALEGRRLEEL